MNNGDIYVLAKGLLTHDAVGLDLNEINEITIKTI